MRIKSRLSQVEFAAALGVSKRSLEQWEQGRHKPSDSAKQLLVFRRRSHVNESSGWLS
ncbi:MAG: helix-turn-helix domain-containing protein [Nitrospiraceae bacterium]|nr:helix-turn-helix domain-containing protein [Nitrospiraceae bacterium]